MGNDRVGDSEGDVTAVDEVVYVYDGQRSCSCCNSSSCWLCKSRYFCMANFELWAVADSV